MGEGGLCHGNRTNKIKEKVPNTLVNILNPFEARMQNLIHLKSYACFFFETFELITGKSSLNGLNSKHGFLDCLK